MTTQELRRYKTIFFDLDGTLLPIDMDTFLREYFSKLKAFADARGYDGEKILFAVNKGVKAMLEEDARANDLCFWETFEALSGFTRAEFEPLLMEFYENDFDEIGETVMPNPAACALSRRSRRRATSSFLLPCLSFRLSRWRRVFVGRASMMRACSTASPPTIILMRQSLSSLTTKRISRFRQESQMRS